MLEAMALRGHIAISGRKGRQRYWDLPKRVYPADLPTLDPDAALRHRNERRLAALGIARSTGPQIPGEPPYVGDAGDEAVVEGTPGTWRGHPAYVGLPSKDGRRCSHPSTGSSTTASAPSSSSAFGPGLEEVC
jgi:hypothetical protein